MKFLSAAHTDTGISKKVNQDAFCLKTARTPRENIVFAVLCDGMGGLKEGEVASGQVVNSFSDWFEESLPVIIKKGMDWNKVSTEWNDLLGLQNKKIIEYGRTRGISLGTTFTAVLIVGKEYMYIHIGDSRIYRINSDIKQITKDQTLVAHEVEMHRLTEEEALTDSRRHILLQCVGVTPNISPEIKKGEVNENDVFLICSDGFRHQIDEKAMFDVLAPRFLTNEKVMKKTLVDLVELNKSLNEKDNITALLIKAVR